jgi:hypothetical protein
MVQVAKRVKIKLQTKKKLHLLIQKYNYAQMTLQLLIILIKKRSFRN